MKTFSKILGTLKHQPLAARLWLALLIVGFFRPATEAMAQCSTNVGQPLGWGSMSAPFFSYINPLTNIAAGYSNGIAIQQDGTVIAWGDNSFGQASTGGLANVTAVAAGRACCLAVSGGLLVGWGDTNSPVRSIRVKS